MTGTNALARVIDIADRQSVEVDPGERCTASELQEGDGDWQETEEVSLDKRGSRRR